jgi:hypothetical protein
MKVILAFPPQFDPTIPNLALPCLTAVLRAAGHQVIQKDLNLESYDRLLSGEELERAFATIRANYPTLQFLQPNLPVLRKLALTKDRLVREVEQAKRAWRDPREFYNYRRLAGSKHLLEEALRFIALQHSRSRLSLTGYEMYYSPDSTEQILQAVRDPSMNLYTGYYSRHVIPEFMEAAPQVVGISISCRSQVIPGLTLAYQLKQALPHVHIVIGGIHFTNLRDSLAGNYGLFSLFDSVVLFEGETALVRLVRCLENGESLRSVPNLIFKDGREIISNDIYHIENIDELPTPCYDGLPLERYFSPQPVLLIYASRGCYWGRCAFCNHADYAGNRYRLRKPSQVRADIETLMQKHGCRNFGLVDLAVSPSALDRLAAEITQSGLQINWFSMARLERKLNKQLSGVLAKSGCKMLLFGLESGSSRILSRMDKGIDTDGLREVLAASHGAGIANFVSFIFGFPGETADEAKETIRMIQTLLEYITSITIQSFQLERNTRVYRNPGDYNVVEINHPKERDLAWGYHYRVGEGLAPKEAAHLAGEVFRICETAYSELFDMFLPYFLYIIRYKCTNPVQLKTRSQGKFFRAIFIYGSGQRKTANIQRKLAALIKSLQ